MGYVQTVCRTEWFREIVPHLETCRRLVVVSLLVVVFRIETITNPVAVARMLRGVMLFASVVAKAAAVNPIGTVNVMVTAWLSDPVVACTVSV